MFSILHDPLALPTIFMAADIQPWFDNGGMVGGIIGAGVGVLGGAIYGPMMGILVPKGKAKKAVFTYHFFLLALGLVLVVAGITGLINGQPYSVWYSLLLPGVILSILMISFLPMVRMQYIRAEQRLLEAEEFRRT